MAMLPVFVVACLVLCYVGSTAGADLTSVVTTKSGSVQGFKAKSGKGRDFNAFVGIPYGKPTSGALRFKPPQPAEAWEGVFQANNPTALCPQMNLGTRKMFGQEDCLHLNVYTPKLPADTSSAGLPVLVFIHGGAFLFGTGSFLVYRPHRYMDEDVILVTLNYRLGLLGFLDTEDDLSPGNYGLLDQLQALKWVQANIQAFGGDPAKVTIFGESAGSASVLYHVLSPLSKGLFSSAIAQSGTALNHFALQRRPLDAAKRAAKAVNCSTDTNEELFSCFQEQSALDLAMATASLHVNMLPIPNFAPTVTGSRGEGFLPEEPRKLLQDGNFNKVPMIVGIMDQEGYLLLLDLKPTVKTTGKQYIDQQFCTHVSWVFDIEGSMTDVCEKIAKVYFDGSDVEDPEVLERGLVKILGDAGVGAAVVKTIEYLSAAGVPVQVYKFTHHTEHYAIAEYGGVPGKYSTHADELTIQFDFRPLYIPKDPNELRTMREDDRQMNDILSNVWTQFAANQENQLQYDIPDGKLSWPLYDANNVQYLDLNTKSQMKSGFLSDKVHFWNDQVPHWANESNSIKKEEL